MIPSSTYRRKKEQREGTDLEGKKEKVVRTTKGGVKKNGGVRLAPRLGGKKKKW